MLRSTDKDLVVSVVITLCNEAALVEKLLDRVTAVMEAGYSNYEIIVVDDGSVDNTAALLRERLLIARNLRVLVLSKQFGKEIATTAGLDHAIGDFVVILPADFASVADLLPQLVARAQLGFDVVYLALGNASQKGPLHYRLASSAFHRLNQRLTGIAIDDHATEFQALSRRVVNAIVQFREHNRVLRMLFGYIGYKVDAVVLRDSQLAEAIQRTSYGEKVKLAIDSLISFSHRPLRYVALLSVVISIATLLAAVYVFVDKLINTHVVEGWSSLMVVLLIMFCILFLFLSVISEYIFRILDEFEAASFVLCKRRPWRNEF